MIGKLHLHSYSGDHGERLGLLLLTASLAEIPEKHPGIPAYEKNDANAGDPSFLINDIPGQKPLCCL